MGTTRARPDCVGCQFVRQFTPHTGGWCRVHGNIAPVTHEDPEKSQVIRRLGGDQLSLAEDKDDGTIPR